MTKTLSVFLLCMATGAALAQDSAIGNETPAAEQAPDKTATESSAAVAEAKEEEPFTPPPGFQVKKRGELVLYCKRDRETGTRFTTEKCYDEEQVRDYLMALEIQKRDIDRIRSTCANASVCAPQ